MQLLRASTPHVAGVLGVWAGLSVMLIIAVLEA